MKKILYFLIGFVAILSVGMTAVVASKSYLIPWTGGEKIAIATCGDPTALGVKNILSNSAEIYWDDATGSEWEYVVQDLGSPLPSGSGFPTTMAKQVTVQAVQTGAALQPNTQYEFYVRSKCSSGVSQWVGPYVFKTTCNSVSAFPFLETFESNSATKDCWTLVDKNKDGKDLPSGEGENKWQWGNGVGYKGTKSMIFNGNGISHDDWLISPGFQLNGGIYEVTYYYNNMYWGETEYEVLMATGNTDLSSFSSTIVQKSLVKEKEYTKVTKYISGVSGLSYLAWHINGNGNSTFSVDEVSVKAISCYPPEGNLKIGQLTTNSASITWDDSKNASWEVYVSLKGTGVPRGSGSVVSSKSAIVTTLAGGGTLQPDTAYDVYIRGTCGIGKYSEWIGPVSFKTLCTAFVTPFYEDFEATSKSLNCWIVKDKTTGPETNTGTWGSSNEAVSGSKSMYYSESGLNNAWLISAPVQLSASKTYRLKYKYKADVFDVSNFDVVLTTRGGFDGVLDKKLLSSKGIATNKWQEDKIIISGVGGTTLIGFHMIGSLRNSLYIDDFSLEEISCSEPFNLTTKAGLSDRVTLSWEDDINTSWEYVVQGEKEGIPMGSGISTNSKQITVNKLNSGGLLKSNSIYEYYVRAKCNSTMLSVWQGPFVFRTGCDLLGFPLKESFNDQSTTRFCWSIIDGNNDKYGEYGIWYRSSGFAKEGTHGMGYKDVDIPEITPANDWLVSPHLPFVNGKVYRVTYDYALKGGDVLELYTSASGKALEDFTKVAGVKHEKNQDLEWASKKVFISGIKGNGYVGWKIKGKGVKEVSLDNVWIEEIKTCPEPLGLDVDQIEAHKATLHWTDDFGATQWNYVVQQKGGGVPPVGGVLANSKHEVVTTDVTGAKLLGNTEYEFYVRTNCGNGTFSEWSNPFVFKTACGVFSAPFWEGFNTNSKSINCWSTTKTDSTASNWEFDVMMNVYEGDRAATYNQFVPDEQLNDWLISPAMELENAQYILKYHYSASSDSNTKFAVKLSDKDKDPISFTTVLTAPKVYRNDNYLEGVTLFTAKAGINYIGWQVTGDEKAILNIDNVYLKKIENCVEPIKLKIVQTTSNSIDISWTQTGQVQGWEIKLVDYTGNENSPALATMVVPAGASTATVTGLSAAKGYKVFVRAKCMNGQYSDWSTGIVTGTKVKDNDNCIGALKIPVNSNNVCTQVLSTGMYSATNGTVDTPECFEEMYKDVWFEFTAIEDAHVLSIFDFISESEDIELGTLGITLYDQPCGSITTVSKECYVFDYGENKVVLKNLIPGSKYYIRIGIPYDYIKKTNVLMTLCLSTHYYIKASDSKYTSEELVKKVLVNSKCDLISNVKAKSGNDFGQDNGIGYFEKRKSDFRFKEGIILSTGGVKYAEGPGNSESGRDNNYWLGDSDLQDLLEASGNMANNVNASVLEFDFVPISADIKFNFIFASNEYGPRYQCKYSDIFAFLLTDLTTNERKNIAVIPKTEIPVSVTTIRDEKYQGGLTCGSANKEYFDAYYGPEGLEMIDNAINFDGRTIPMEAYSKVIPGRKYHIKLAIADYMDSTINSAVFLEAGSFKMDGIDLGKDMLVDTGNALCSGTTVVLDSQMDISNPEITVRWEKDGQPYPLGNDKSKIEVKEAGVYKMTANFKQVNCPTSGMVKVEIYPPVDVDLNKAMDVPACRLMRKDLVLDLTQAVKQLFKNGNSEAYVVTYYTDKEMKEKIVEPTKFLYKMNRGEQLIYIQITFVKTGCSANQSFKIMPTKGEMPVQPQNVTVCGSYSLPMLADNQMYYAESGGKGQQYKGGDVLGPGKYELFVYQDNGSGCYEEVSFKIEITRPVGLKPFEDVRLECSYYVVPKEDNKYTKFYRVVKNGLVPLIAGTIIYESETEIVVIAETDNKVCKEEARFTIRYNDCPIPKGISPNGDGLNDAFDLSQHGATKVQIFNRQGTEVYSYTGNYTNQWNGKTSSGKDLPSGTYYYVIHAFEKTRTGWVEISR